MSKIGKIPRKMRDCVWHDVAFGIWHDVAYKVLTVEEALRLIADLGRNRPAYLRSKNNRKPRGKR